MYKTINEAAARYNLPELAEGNTKIWFFKDEVRRDFLFGVGFAEQQMKRIVDVSNIGETHVMIGKIASENLEDIFTCMQGEMWSKGGEAFDMISASGAGHTSMSVGDAIQIGSSLFIVNPFGFIERF